MTLTPEKGQSEVPHHAHRAPVAPSYLSHDRCMTSTSQDSVGALHSYFFLQAQSQV